MKKISKIKIRSRERCKAKLRTVTSREGKSRGNNLIVHETWFGIDFKKQQKRDMKVTYRGAKRDITIMSIYVDSQEKYTFQVPFLW